MKNVIDYGNIYSENLLYLIINEADEYIEEKNGNEYYYWKSTHNFGMKLNIWQYMVLKKMNMKKSSWKLNLFQKIIYLMKY